MKVPYLSRKLAMLILSFTVLISGFGTTLVSVREAAASASNPNLGPLRIYQWLPAPGQFINEPSWGGTGDINEVWNNNNLSSGVSLGGFGGSIIFKMDSPVLNSPDHPYGADFTVYGNAFSGFEEPAAVAVAQDDGTGKPGQWYDIAGSEHYEDTTIRNYQATYINPEPEFTSVNGVNIPWSDNYTGNGLIKINGSHKHAYYPIPDNYPLKPDDFSNISYTYSGVNIGIRKNAFGYPDTHANGTAPYDVASNPYATTGNKGDPIDISWAVDSNGLPVNLDHIDFIKVSTAVQMDGGPFGEVSSEVTGVIPHGSDPAVQATPDLTSIVLTSTNAPAITSEIPITSGKNIYDEIIIDADAIKVTAKGVADYLFVNNKSGAVGTPVDKILALSETTPRLVRVIAQQGTNEPRIYYLRILKGKTLGEQVTSAIAASSQHILATGVSSDWQAVGLAQADKNIPDSYYRTVLSNVQGADGIFSRVTDYARTSIGISALGYDPTNFATYNLIERIYNNEKMTNQGINGPIYSLIALDTRNFSVPDTALWSRAKLVSEIVKNQNPDGGFGYSPESSDPDLTAMALIAIAPYKDNPEAATAGDKAVQWLSLKQQTHGGYNSYGADSSESVSQAIIALTANGIDPTGPDFTKNGINLVQKLLSFQKQDGGFAHILTSGSNGMATEQALQALAAYRLFQNQEGALYNLNRVPLYGSPVSVKIEVEGPQGQLASGTVIGRNALEALQQLGSTGNLDVQIKERSQYGPYVESIDGIEAGHFGGYDGWNYVVERDGKWRTPPVGMSEYILSRFDHILIYYGNSSTQLVHSITASPEQPAANEPFTVTVEQSSWDWNLNEDVITKAADAAVTINGVTIRTDENGAALFPSGLSNAGTYKVSVDHYVENGPPLLVRREGTIAIGEQVIVSPVDPNPVDPNPPVIPNPVDPANPGNPNPVVKTITLSVIGDSQKGTILSARNVTLAAGDTAFSVLKRELGSKVLSSGSGATAYVSAIDGLAEFDRGPESGWMYMVNGQFPAVGAGLYPLSNGDSLAWRYTLNLGKDLGDPSTGASPVTGTGTPAGTPSIPQIIETEINKAAIKPNNTLPIGKAGTTTQLLNGSEKMSKEQIDQLAKALASASVSLTQNVAADSETILKDALEKIRFIVPSGALAQALTVKIEESKTDKPGFVTAIFDFTPNGTEFQKPVYLQFKVPVWTDKPENLAIVWLNEKTGEWIPIPAVLDLKSGTITGKVTHFTKFAVVDKSRLAEKSRDVSAEIQAAVSFITAGDSLSDWEAFALARSGTKVPAAYLTQLKALLNENNGDFRKVTDLERIALVLRAMGEDPTTFAGYNLIQNLYSSKNMTSQGTNGPLFALLALDSDDYTVPADALWTRSKLVDWIVQQQKTNGAFPLTPDGEDNLDMTAMAVTALAPYLGQAEVKKAVDQSVSWLSSQQLESGGYNSYGDENSETTAQVIIALTAIGVNPADDRFVKKNGDLLANLFGFRQADGGFAHVAGQQTNEMATEQALMALVAYDRYSKGQSGLYDLSDSKKAPAQTGKFIDDSQISAWASAAVYRVYQAELMVGLSTTELQFGPKQKMTRAQFATLLVNLLGATPDKDAAVSFVDVKPGSWYYGSVMKAKEKGIIQGISADSFQPDRAVSRQEMAIMIARAFKLSPDDASFTFKDESSISKNARNDIEAVYDNGLMVGFDGYFNPADSVTREMAAVVADKLHELSATQ
ncbi:S-layer homology domain-containing protein [Paenibacillus nasutitermitis]|uniref:SLH domain-containing protein n=1 Tax=Paenibacillus nasutitermitis TaxID=1652958 RepID=A0A916YRT3_9BACL|nr:S-layer homology domain-containing protein [Paenibacillus nasutitermitis]GGD57539.1 hypothetical protein GCM10010911_14190 [Paenibacillus nasutitermitis]